MQDLLPWKSREEGASVFCIQTLRRARTVALRYMSKRCKGGRLSALSARRMYVSAASATCGHCNLSRDSLRRIPWFFKERYRV